MSTTSDYSYAAPELAPYRAVCRSAVMSLATALISLPLVVMAVYSATFRYGDAVPLGLVGAVLALVALVLGWTGIATIRRYPSEYTGRLLARSGLLGGLLLFATGASVSAFTYVTEVPKGYERVTFADLQPDRENYPDLPVSPKAIDLAGKKIFIKGYMHPSVASLGRVNHFILVNDFGTCCFGGQPKPTHMIEIYVPPEAQGVAYSTGRLKLTGTFAVATQPSESLGLNGVWYHMRVDQVREAAAALMFLGIEIGGTKLQLGVGTGDGGELATVVREDVDPRRGAAGILEQIERSGAALIQKHPIGRIGIGFGGPVDGAAGVATKSHQIDGWEGFPLARWCREALGKPAVIGNDCDVAALAEAHYGAGRGANSVFYVTVGTGIGGGLVLGGRLHGASRPAASEIGHLRPGLNADRPDMTVESLASGPAIAAAAVARMTGQVSRPLDSIRGPLPHANRQQVQRRLADVKDTEEEYIADLLERCGNDAERLTAKLVAEAAADGNEIARQVLDHACQALGWALAQTITLIAPEIIVVGGGVSLIGEQFLFMPLRAEVARYVFPPLTNQYKIVPAALGELAVVHGAIALARGADIQPPK